MGLRWCFIKVDNTHILNMIVGKENIALAKITGPMNTMLHSGVGCKTCDLVYLCPGEGSLLIVAKRLKWKVFLVKLP